MGVVKWIIGVLFLFATAYCVIAQDEDFCERITIPTLPKRPGDNGYRIRIDRLPTHYEPGQQYRVLLQSTTPVSFREFSLVATVEGAPDEPAGTFEIIDSLKTRTSPSCSHVVTHTFSSSKTSISALWTAPSPGSGCVNFRAWVIQRKSVWFAEDGYLTLQLCERVEPTGATGPTPSATPDPYACCAPPHQEAKYRFTFVSTWTPETHPNEYPTGRGNHWSDLIGASHGSAYTIWDYGQYASFGIKMVAEWGSPNRLEQEIRLEGDTVKTVILSRGLFPAYGRNLRNMTALFKTDARRNLVSAVSMMGPSPDWCVGITRENLCTADCGWVERREFYLQPWDAGTDSGIQYQSSNSPQDPPDPIRPITSSDPAHPRAPFYNANGDPIPPLATIILERVSVRNYSSSETDHSASSHGGNTGGVMPPKPGMMVKDPTMPPKHMGGTMPPKNMGPTMPPKHMGETMPPKHMGPTMPPKVMGPTMPQKNMELPTDTPQTMPPKRRGGRNEVVDCMMAAWGDWSECTKTCGRGKMVRQRMVKRRPRNGGLECEPTREKKTCNMGKCMSKGTSRSRDCRMGDWGAWSECSVTCGEGVEFRMRDIERPARGQGAPCGAQKEMRVCEATPCQ